MKQPLPNHGIDEVTRQWIERRDPSPETLEVARLRLNERLARTADAGEKQHLSDAIYMVQKRWLVKTKRA